MKTKLVQVLDYILGCRHRNRSWPRVNLKRGSRGYYQSCLDCGKSLPYRNDDLVPGSENAA